MTRASICRCMPRPRFFLRLDGGRLEHRLLRWVYANKPEVAARVIQQVELPARRVKNASSRMRNCQDGGGMRITTQPGLTPLGAECRF